MRPPRSLMALGLVVALAAAACHPSTTPSSGSSLRNVITQDQIDSSDAHSVYELIARTRPEFLRDRGSVSIKQNIHERAVVFINGQEYGILETLHNLAIGRFSEVRFYPGIDAVAKFGAQYGGGVVELISRTE